MTLYLFHTPLFTALRSCRNGKSFPSARSFPAWRELLPQFSVAMMPCYLQSGGPGHPEKSVIIGAWKKIPLLFGGLKGPILSSESVRFLGRNISVSQNHGSGKSAVFEW